MPMWTREEIAAKQQEAHDSLATAQAALATARNTLNNRQDLVTKIQNRIEALERLAVAEYGAPDLRPVQAEQPG